MTKIVVLILFNSLICESLAYDVYFKKINVGSAILKSKQINDDSNEILFTMKTKKFIDFVYKIREKITMVVNKDNYSLAYIKKNTQHKNQFIKYEKNIDNKIKLYDPISIIYYLRNQKLFLDKSFIFNIFKPNNNQQIGMQVIGEELIYSMKKNHACFILAPFNDSHEKGKVKIWISKEDKIPIIIEQHGKSGKIIMKLNKIIND